MKVKDVLKYLRKTCISIRDNAGFRFDSLIIDGRLKNGRPRAYEEDYRVGILDTAILNREVDYMYTSDYGTLYIKMKED